MKKFKHFLTIFTLALALFCLVLFTGCDGETLENSLNFNSSSSSSTHVCENVCPECGKCLDATCKDPVCAEKCEGHVVEEIPIVGAVRYEFDAVKGYAQLSCAADKAYNASTNPSGAHVESEAGVGSWLTNFTWNNDAKLTLNVYSDKECQADFVLKVRKTSEVITLTNKISVDIAGDILESTAQVPASQDGASAEFAEVNIGQFWLEEGNNVITISPQTSTANFDFSAIILYSDADANLRWNELKDVTGDIFYGIDEHVVISDTYKKNQEENCIGPHNVYEDGYEGDVDHIVTSAYTSNKAKWPVYASRDALATISVITCSMPQQWAFTSIYDFIINGEQQTSATLTPYSQAQWGDYQLIELGEYELKAGLNEIEINKPDGSDASYMKWFNIRAIIIDTDATIDWVEVEAETHICLHVCPICGGCKTETCTEENCLTKCSCAHVCEDVCPICGGCTTDCDKEECATKCSCVETEFLAIDERVAVGGTGSRNKGESQVGTGSGTMTVTYTLTATTAGKARLYFNTSSDWGATQILTNMFPVTVNGTAVTSSNTTHGGTWWSNYQWDEVAIVDLAEGTNVIVISYSPASWQNTNFHGIKLSTAVAVDWSESADNHTCAHICETCGKCYDYTCFNAACLDLCTCEHTCSHVCASCGKCYDTTCVRKECVNNRCTHVCESVCDTCGKCQNSSCTHYACTEKCQCLTNYVFNAVDEKTTISEGLSKNVEGNYVDVTDLSKLQKVTFTIYSSKAQTVKLGFCISENPTASWTLADYFRVWVNVDASLCNDEDGSALKLSKEVYTATTIQGAGTNYDNIMIGDVELQEGANTITIAWTCVGSEAYKFTLRSLLIDAKEEVSWVA
jgi:hypothetical protein